MKKQTAVEWFIEQLTKNPLPQSKDEFIDGDLVDIINKAKEMEKQQIIDAIVNTQKEYIIQASCYPPQFILDKAFNYYKETFKQD
jgi:hypothetical protein